MLRHSNTDSVLVSIGAQVIGINNRDFDTMKVDLQTTAESFSGSAGPGAGQSKRNQPQEELL